jgi:hypothetical protein
MANVSYAAPPVKQAVDLEITLPNRGVPRVRVKDREGAVVTLPDGRRFGFVPTLREGSAGSVLVEIWELNEQTRSRLGEVEVEPAAAMPVPSQTTPSFGIRVLRIVPSK